MKLETVLGNSLIDKIGKQNSYIIKETTNNERYPIGHVKSVTNLGQ
jgi:hypothetical protein